MNVKCEQLIQFQVERNIVNLYKKLLSIIDDMGISHEDMMEKIAKDLSSKDLAKLADLNYLTPNFISHLRKKILDAGNDSIREIKTVLEKVEIDFKR